jgi:hypothetical protein
MEVRLMFGTIAALLQVLAKVAGARGVDSGLVDALVFGANLVNEGMQGKAELEALTKRIQTLVDEGRSFTEAERAELRAQSDAAHSRLQALADDAPEAEPTVQDGDGNDLPAGEVATESPEAGDNEPDPAEDTPTG